MFAMLHEIETQLNRIWKSKMEVDKKRQNVTNYNFTKKIAFDNLVIRQQLSQQCCPHNFMSRVLFAKLDKHFFQGNPLCFAAFLNSVCSKTLF